MQGEQAALDSLAGEAEGADLALALELGEGFVDAGFAQNRHIIAIGVHQQQLDVLALQALEAALDREAGMGRAEIEQRLAADEFLADLADDHPLVALAAQQRAEALLAGAVGRRGVDQVDAQLAGLLQQCSRGGVIGNGEAVGVFHALVAAQLDRAQPQWRYAQAGGAQRPVPVMQGGGAHGSRVSQAGWATAGRGSGGSAG